MELRNHRDDQILLDTEGEVTGQINGLSVIETAGTTYEYGEPVRITATLRAGGDGDVIDIERKAELAAKIKKLERDCFNPQVRPVLNELRARYDEINKAIKVLEHEV